MIAHEVLKINNFHLDIARKNRDFGKKGCVLTHVCIKKQTALQKEKFRILFL